MSVRPENSAPCPICKKEYAAKDSAFFPFCSERCKLIDLGKWIDGDYRIAGGTATDWDVEAGEKDEL
ncbi:MAG: DNA gyrase inhibitor YacG [Candidatus Nitrohelix vancouverensis]|uniref:DNA gyrase inhibitor YacG n=1 Tax=Candidatus Nitrohelix vancouverensis TaxID=2705534 RepID=A0A7T0C1A8_9BACT|nr:MAG: DNA gyrase inhibitor YacG [Candidatus Nitrohelix vancouverensis]